MLPPSLALPTYLSKHPPVSLNPLSGCAPWYEGKLRWMLIWIKCEETPISRSKYVPEILMQDAKRHPIFQRRAGAVYSHLKEMQTDIQYFADVWPIFRRRLNISETVDNETWDVWIFRNRMYKQDVHHAMQVTWSECRSKRDARYNLYFVITHAGRLCQGIFECPSYWSANVSGENGCDQTSESQDGTCWRAMIPSDDTDCCSQVNTDKNEMEMDVRDFLLPLGLEHFTVCHFVWFGTLYGVSLFGLEHLTVFFCVLLQSPASKVMRTGLHWAAALTVFNQCLWGCHCCTESVGHDHAFNLDPILYRQYADLGFEFL